MRSFASADGLGALVWPGAQKKCFGLLGGCAAAAELANANSKATIRCKPEIGLAEGVRIFDLPRRDEGYGLTAPPDRTARASVARSKSLETRNSTQVPGCAQTRLRLCS